MSVTEVAEQTSSSEGSVVSLSGSSRMPSSTSNHRVGPQGRAVLSNQPALSLYKLCGLALVQSRALTLIAGSPGAAGLIPRSTDIEPVSACPSGPLHFGPQR